MTAVALPSAQEQAQDAKALRIAWALVLGGLLAVLDVVVTNVAIGSLSRDFDAPLTTIQWVTTGYALALATVIPTAVWAVGRFGAKRVYLSALTAFLAGSALTGLAWDVRSLIAFRFLQGLGGGLLIPVGMTLVLRATRPSQRGRVMSVLGLPILVGPAAGVVLGGWLLDALSWRWLFFVNLPLGLVALVVVSRVLDHDEPDQARRLDVPGLLLLSPGLGLLVYGVATGGERGTALEAGALVPAMAGLALVVAFVRRALAAEVPLVDIRMLRLRPMAIGAGSIALFASAYFGSMFLAPLYLQAGRGLSATEAGALAIPQALATGVALQVASRLIDRTEPRRIILTGILLAAAGFGAFGLLAGLQAPLVAVVLAMTLSGIGVGMTLMPSVTTATRALSPAEASTGSALLTITQQVSIVVGTAVNSIVLARLLTDRLPGVVHTGVGDVYRLSDPDREAVSGPLGAAFGWTFVVPVGLMLLALLLVSTAMPRRTTPG